MQQNYIMMGAALLLAGQLSAETYKGYEIADCAYFQNYGFQIAAQLEIADNDSITFTSQTWGTFCYGAGSQTITESEEGQTVTATGICLMPSMRTGEITEYYSEMTLTTNADGYVKGDFVVPGVMGGTTVHFGLVNESYPVYEIADCAYFQNYGFALGSQLSISPIAADTVTIAYSSPTWGEYKMDSTLVSLTDGVLTFKGFGTVLMNGHGGPTEYYAEDSLVLDGVKLSGVFNVPAVMGGTTLHIGNYDIPYAFGAEGTYTVNEIADCAYFSDYGWAEAQTVTATAVTADSIKIDYVSPTWGTFSFPAVLVEYADEDAPTYKLKGEGTVAMPGMDGSVREYYAEIDAQIVDGAFSGTFNVPGVMGGTKVRLGDIPEPVGIQQIDAEAAAPVIYDLQGRQLRSMQKGLLIVGGKKVIVK